MNGSKVEPSEPAFSAAKPGLGSVAPFLLRGCHPPEVVSDAVQVKLDLDLLGSPKPGLSHPAGSLDPPEGRSKMYLLFMLVS